MAPYPQVDFDLAARMRIFDRIVDDVEDELPQTEFVAPHGRRLNRAHDDIDLALLAQEAGLALTSSTNAQPDRLASVLTWPMSAREEQQFLDNGTCGRFPQIALEHGDVIRQVGAAQLITRSRLS